MKSNASFSSNTDALITQPNKSRRKSIKRRASVISNQVGTLMDVSLLKDSLFLSYCLAVGITICARILSGLYLIRYAQSVGIDDHSASRLITVVETASFVMCPVASILTSLRFKKEFQYGKFCVWTPAHLNAVFFQESIAS